MQRTHDSKISGRLEASFDDHGMIDPNKDGRIPPRRQECSERDISLLAVRERDKDHISMPPHGIPYQNPSTRVYGAHLKHRTCLLGSFCR